MSEQATATAIERDVIKSFCQDELRLDPIDVRRIAMDSQQVYVEMYDRDEDGRIRTEVNPDTHLPEPLLTRRSYVIVG